MGLYRFCFLDTLAQPVIEERLQATDDADAIEIAKILARRMGIEVWQGQRRVGLALPNGSTILLDSQARA
jgi:hypothetical protein